MNQISGKLERHMNKLVSSELTLDYKEDNLSKFHWIFLDTCIISPSSEIVCLLKIIHGRWNLLSYNTSIQHSKNSADILCPLWGLCDLGVCMNRSESQFFEPKNRDDTFLWVVCNRRDVFGAFHQVWMVLINWQSLSFLTTRLYANINHCIKRFFRSH